MSALGTTANDTTLTFVIPSAGVHIESLETNQ
jgi:hypothetical protein